MRSSGGFARSYPSARSSASSALMRASRSSASAPDQSSRRKGSPAARCTTGMGAGTFFHTNPVRSTGWRSTTPCQARRSSATCSGPCSSMASCSTYAPRVLMLWKRIPCCSGDRGYTSSTFCLPLRASAVLPLIYLVR